MLLIASDTVSEFGYTNSSFTVVFFTTCGAKYTIKKNRTATRKTGLQIECFITIFNLYELPKSELAQHSHYLSGHL